MDDANFVSIAGLICEPVRAKILWKLLDGRAYTATELAISADVSTSSASNHLTKLLHGKVLKVDTQGRHRYYSFAHDDVAYAVEALANLTNGNDVKYDGTTPTEGITYCRTCYDHLAGYVGVLVTEALTKKGYLQKNQKAYHVTKEGWHWFSQFEIYENEFVKSRRPLTRQCLDWSERRPHLAGHLGAALLDLFMKNDWFRRVEFSRELVITTKGKQALSKELHISLE